MGASHTPGPWDIERSDNSIMADGRDGEGWTIAYLGEPVDFAGCNRENLSAAINGEIDANACLISAAPDLLSELRDTLDLLCSVAPEYAESTTAANARAAITKATGGVS